MKEGTLVSSLETLQIEEVVSEAKDLAIDLAMRAGMLLRGSLNEPRDIAHKGTVDLVTDADKASEALISTGIRSVFPEHRLIGEEGARGEIGNHREGHAFGWVIDPLDGTTNFAHRYPHFAVSIGLEHRGHPVMGVVYDPMRDEMFVGIDGAGATLNGQPIRVSRTVELIESLLATGFPYDLTSRAESNALWQAFNGRIQGVRRDGAAALNLCYVAAGRLDGFWERPLQPWDMGAGVVIVREAGGTISSLEHDEHNVYGKEVVATNGVLQAPIRDQIAKTLRGVRGA